jgi:TusA-related sulfurtransferase
MEGTLSIEKIIVREDSMEVAISKTVDCRKENCPMPLVKTRKAIMDAREGDIIKVIGTHPQSFEEIPLALEALELAIIKKGYEGSTWYIIFGVS